MFENDVDLCVNSDRSWSEITAVIGLLWWGVGSQSRAPRCLGTLLAGEMGGLD